MRLPAALVLCSLLLAGCSSSSDGDDGGDGRLTVGDDGTTPPRSSSPSAGTTSTASPHTLTVSNFPQVSVRAGSAFSYKLDIAGPEASSDHIGGHFASSPVPSPVITAYSNACNHIEGDAPGTYTITCTAPAQAGTYYLRAHMRTGVDPSHAHAWSAEQTFTVHA